MAYNVFMATHDPDCIFCKIIKQEIPSDKVYEDEFVYAFKDINPISPTHILVIPKKHFANLNEVEAEDKHFLSEILFRAKEIAKEQGIENGFRTIINTGTGAGQTVFHIHLHLLGGRTYTWPPG